LATTTTAYDYGQYDPYEVYDEHVVESEEFDL
jgi:hypothetical protein